VEKYFSQKLLSSLGYNLNIQELEEYEIEAFHLIANAINEEERKELKKKKR